MARQAGICRPSPGKLAHSAFRNWPSADGDVHKAGELGFWCGILLVLPDIPPNIASRVSHDRSEAS